MLSSGTKWNTASTFYHALTNVQHERTTVSDNFSCGSSISRPCHSLPILCLDLKTTKSTILASRGGCRNELGWAGCEKGCPKVDSKSGTHFLPLSVAEADQKETQNVSEVGVSGLANPDTITVQSDYLKWSNGVTIVTQNGHESDQEGGQK